VGKWLEEHELNQKRLEDCFQGFFFLKYVHLVVTKKTRGKIWKSEQ
jgi:hypothetical protein